MASPTIDVASPVNNSIHASPPLNQFTQDTLSLLGSGWVYSPGYTQFAQRWFNGGFDQYTEETTPYILETGLFEQDGPEPSSLKSTFGRLLIPASYEDMYQRIRRVLHMDRYIVEHRDPIERTRACLDTVGILLTGQPGTGTYFVYSLSTPILILKQGKVIHYGTLRSGCFTMTLMNPCSFFMQQISYTFQRGMPLQSIPTADHIIFLLHPRKSSSPNV